MSRVGVGSDGRVRVNCATRRVTPCCDEPGLCFGFDITARKSVYLASQVTNTLRVTLAPVTLPSPVFCGEYCNEGGSTIVGNTVTTTTGRLLTGLLVYDNVAASLGRFETGTGGPFSADPVVAAIQSALTPFGYSLSVTVARAGCLRREGAASYYPDFIIVAFQASNVVSGPGIFSGGVGFSVYEQTPSTDVVDPSACCGPGDSGAGVESVRAEIAVNVNDTEEALFDTRYIARRSSRQPPTGSNYTKRVTVLGPTAIPFGFTVEQFIANAAAIEGGCIHRLDGCDLGEIPPEGGLRRAGGEQEQSSGGTGQRGGIPGNLIEGSNFGCAGCGG